MGPSCERSEDGSVVSRCCARIGLLGNPSDGYGGAVIGLSLANFAAEVLHLAAASRLPLPLCAGWGRLCVPSDRLRGTPLPIVR